MGCLQADCLEQSDVTMHGLKIQPLRTMQGVLKVTDVAHNITLANALF